MVKLNAVIYADILIVINIIINYLLLRASAAVINCEFKPKRFLIASLMGGVFSLIIFVENLPVWAGVVVKIAFSALMTAVAFGIKSVKAFLKCYAAFFVANFVFAGIIVALVAFVKPNAALYRNGVVYFDADAFTLVSASLVCYAALKALSAFTKSRPPSKCVYEIKIFYGEKSVGGKALYDSGDALRDCFSGKPAIIAEKDFIRPLLGRSEISDMKNFRLIPFSTLQNGGALEAFRADKVEIRINGSFVPAKEIYIAVADKKIVSGGYSALLGAPLFDAVECGIKRGRAAERKRVEK